MQISEEGSKKPEIDFDRSGVVAQPGASKGLELAQVLGVGPQGVRRGVALVFKRGQEAINLLPHGSRNGLGVDETGERQKRALGKSTAATQLVFDGLGQVGKESERDIRGLVVMKSEDGRGFDDITVAIPGSDPTDLLNVLREIGGVEVLSVIPVE